MQSDHSWTETTSPGRDWAVYGALLLAIFYLVTSILTAAHRLLWFDEIVSVLFGRLPGFAAIWKAAGIVDPWGMPAPYYFLIHLFQKSGPAEISARLPSALAVSAGLLIVFDCTRRLTNGLYGLLAMALLTCSFLPYYGFEARSYGICFMLTALSLWVWAHTSDSRRSSALAFGLVFFAGFLMQPYFVLCLLPFAAFECSLWPPIQRPRGKIFAAAGGIFCGAAVLSLHILSAGAHRTAFPGEHPSYSALVGIFGDIFPGGLLLIALIAVWMALATGRGNSAAVPGATGTERMGWLFLLIPLAGYVMGKVATNAFAARYFVSMLPGVAVAFACFFWRYFRSATIVSVGVLSLLAVVGLARQVSVWRHPESIDPFGQQTKTKEVLGLEDAFHRDGKQFIVLAGTLLYLETEYNSKHPKRYRFLQPDDGTVSIPVSFSKYYPLKIWRLQDVKAHARETALIFPEPKLLETLKQAGFTPTVRFNEPIRVVYLQ